ncbi:MAG TPA: hypothetical protein VFL60_00435 [Gaiellaceae bacterium]|nr:hypothetical protein [Gaiellaceae bacterium]
MSVLFENGAYRLALTQAGRRIELNGGDLSLSLLAALDTTTGADETLELLEPELRGDGTIVVERRSTLWERAWLELRCLDGAVEVHTCVRGRGDLTTVRLLGGVSALANGAPLGRMLSGTRLPTLFSPNPEDGAAPFRPAAEGAVTGVLGEGEPGRARWLFTPAPLYWALGPAAAGASGDGTSWLDVGVAAPVEQLRFPEAAWEAAARGFSLRLEYEGRTRVDGEFRAPVLLLTPGVDDVWRGLRRHRDDLAVRGCAPAPAPRETPGWWRRPIFCGWGAQCHLEVGSGRLARDFATQESYDRFLARLAEHGVVPGTVVLDDKWQATYGRNEPDTAKWPDLKAWIAGRHAAGQRVLLWWKAWDPEGLDPELCIRNADGAPVAVDPAAAREELRAAVRSMLVDLDADGFKVDFTARTPAGRGLQTAAGTWGIALLHELLATFYAAAKEAKPDALVITHTPHPAFVDVTDMIRLNDVLGGVDLVEQMELRAEVVRAACPELPIDTDDWRVPDKASWRAFLARKPAIGVPSLYYASHLDATGEELEEEDYAALREVWER